MSPVINPSDKILIIAPHPDDEVIACGGFISKYHNQIDILCVNASGVKYAQDKFSAEEIAQIRMDEFHNVAKIAGVNKVYVEKIWGIPPMIKDIEKRYENYKKHFNMKDYDIILAPHKLDAHIEHRYAGNTLLKRLLLEQGFKPNLKILRYELWSPLSRVNYYEDITDVIENKKKLILSYKIRTGKNYLDKILALNKYRTLSAAFGNQDKYVEAYWIENLDEYFQKADIINKETKIAKDENLLKYLKDVKAQDIIDRLANQYKNKKIVLYGAGIFTQMIFQDYDLSKLNIVAIADQRFEQERHHEFFVLNCIKPDNLIDLDCDIILISNYNFAKFYDILTQKILLFGKNTDIKIKPLISKE